jgi:CheY-like chemotaxis protein
VEANRARSVLAASKSPAAVDASATDIGRSLKVLHVDDDPLNLRVVQEILAAFGHTAVAADSGPEALERLTQEKFDVLLLDIHMPNMSGIEVMELVRSSAGPERGMPIIALTADIISRRPKEYVALGFDDFVSKPILVSGLMSCIKRCLQPPSAEVLSRTA